MFRHSKLPWGYFLSASTRIIHSRYGIKKGDISIDNTDNKRFKNTKRLCKLHKVKDKSSGGYLLGQSLVVLVLVTKKVTFPIGFRLLCSRSRQKKWKENDDELKSKGVAKKQKPPKPARSEQYPSTENIALDLLRQTARNFRDLKIRAVVEDPNP